MFQSVSAPAGKRWFLLFCIMGFGFGVLVTAGMDPSLFSAMRLPLDAQVSIVGSVLCGVLPLLIAAFAVKIYSFPLLSLVLFLRCFCYGCFCWWVASSFGSAAWLFRILLGFSGNVNLVLLIVFGYVSVGREWNRRIFWFVCVLMLAVSFVDYFVVSSFLRAVFLL